MHIQKEFPQTKIKQNYTKSFQIDSIKYTGMKGNTQTEIENFLNQLKSELPGANIQVVQLSDPSEIKNYVKENLDMFQVLLSPEALKNMVQNTAFKEQTIHTIKLNRQEQLQKIQFAQLSGKNILGAGIILDKDGQTKQWLAHMPALPIRYSDPDMYQNQQKNLKEPYKTTIENEWIPKKKASYVPAKDLMRIAKARNQQDVKGAISSIRGKIYQLKFNKDDKKNAYILIGQAEQVLLKAKIKIKRLNEEQLLTSAAKKAAEREQLKKAMQMRQMLEDKQVKRRVREYGQIRDYYPSPSEHIQQKKHEDYHEGIHNTIAITTSVSPIAALPIALPAETSVSIASIGIVIDIGI